MTLPAVVRAKHAFLLAGPPIFGALLGGAMFGLFHKLAVEPGAPKVDFVVLGSIAGVSDLALTFFALGAARVRRGAHTHFPRLWSNVRWTFIGGLAVGLVAAGAHALLK